jgi:uncharacterized membrane protein
LLNVDSRRNLLIYILIITVIGSVLRFYHLNFQSLWLDELHSIIPTDPLNPLPLLLEYCKTDQPPAFFVYLHYVFRIFGFSDINGRIACAIPGILAIPVCYYLGNEVRGKSTGLLTALLVSINYFHIYYSQELRFYSLTFLFSALSYLFFIRAYKTNKLRDFILYTLATAALLYTHYFGLLIYGIQAITFILLAFFYKRDTRYIWCGLFSGLLVFIAFIPWLPVIISDLGIESYWIAKPKIYFLLKYFMEYFGKDALMTIGFIISVGLFLRSFFTGKLKPEEKPLYIIMSAWFVLSYLIPYVKSLLGTSIMSTRYTIVTLPAGLIIFAIAIDAIKNVKWRNTAIVGIILSSFINLFFIRHYYTEPNKSQFREASYLVQTKNGQNYPVLSSITWYFDFYFKDREQKVSDVNSANLDQIDKFWLLQAHFPQKERAAEVEKFSDRFMVAERYEFYEADALLMVKKE